jgi:hypothetical protein
LSGLERLLAQLEQAKRRRPGAAGTARLLRSLARRGFPDAESLVRFHDAVLFLRAYPHSRAVMRLSDAILSGFRSRVERLAASGGDLSDFDHPEVSGIAGTTITTDYSYDVVLWLKRRFGKRVTIDWEEHEATDRLRAQWPKFLPLLEEEALEDANVPYLQYLRNGRRPGEDDLSWLLSRIEGLPLSDAEKTEKYDALGLSVHWELGASRATRTRMRRPARTIFFHDEPLLSRRDVSLEAELSSPPLAIRRLSRREGQAILDTAREAKVVRYREYYGFTFGDPASVLHTDAGRGLQLYLNGIVRGRRLPLRAGHAGFLVKNGVPVGYIEALGFFERIEIGFNVYYAFREGESAWMFARVVKFLHDALGATVFSMDPYQIGHENEEAIKSGALWFYRKLGFRSTDPGLRTLTEREEKKLAADPSYRTPAPVLRRLASRNLLYDMSCHPEVADAPAPPPKSLRRSNEGGKPLWRRRERSDEGSAPVHPQPTSRNPKSAWDSFHIRNLSLAVVRRMARDFGGDAEKIRRVSHANVARALGVRSSGWSEAQSRAFTDLSLVLDLISDLPDWPKSERDAVARIAVAKSGTFESGYLRLMQRHARLRTALLGLGTR